MCIFSIIGKNLKRHNKLLKLLILGSEIKGTEGKTVYFLFKTILDCLTFLIYK